MALQAQHPSSSPAGLLWRTYLRLYKWRMLLQTFWTLCEVAVRCVLAGRLACAWRALSLPASRLATG